MSKERRIPKLPYPKDPGTTLPGLQLCVIEILQLVRLLFFPKSGNSLQRRVEILEENSTTVVNNGGDTICDCPECPVAYDLSFDWGYDKPNALDRRVVPIVRRVDFQADFLYSQAAVGTFPTADVEFTVWKGYSGVDTQIGTVTITTTGAVLFSTVGSAPQFIDPTVHNYFLILPPTPQDATLAAVAITFFAEVAACFEPPLAIPE